MNYEEIKGFNKLNTQEQHFFIQMFNKHQSSLGNEAKSKYIPIKVKVERTYLKVTFKNGEWLHYYTDGSWS